MENEAHFTKGTKRKSSSSGMADRSQQPYTSSDRHNCSTPLSCKYGYQIVTLDGWLGGCSAEQQQLSNEDATNKQSPLPVIDLRPKHEFVKRHLSLSNSTNNSANITQIPVVNLPLPQLLSGERSCELPPRHVPFSILIPNDYISSFLSNDDSSCTIHSLFFATQSTSTLQSRKPWLVRHVILEHDLLWIEAKKLDLLVEKNEDLPGDETGATTNCPFQKLDRLWKPDPLISSDILPLLREKLILDKDMNLGENHSNSSQEQNHGIIIDLGSGAGRDVCFLAEELKEFYFSSSTSHNQQMSTITPTEFPLRFIGIDNHKGSSKRCIPLWRHRGVHDVSQSVLLNLDKWNQVRDFLEATIPSHQQDDNCSPILCIYAIRYLNRKLFANLANSTYSNASQDRTHDLAHAKTESEILTPEQSQHLSLPKGTILAISHFCKPRPSSPWNFDHPKESSVLERWELRDLFMGVMDDDCGTNEKCWKIVKDDICLDGDHGRTLIQFAVVKVR
jgi:hypothetical protein